MRGLRISLGDGAPWDGIPRTPGGYLLRVGPGQRDVDLFEEAAADGRRALALGDPARACEELDRALSLWRGTFLEGLPLPDALDRWAGRLEERRWHAEEDYAQALIAEDRCPEAVLRMRGLVERRPLRQGAWLHLMQGLFRGGDVAGALEAHRRAREVLVRETGLEPGPDLNSLHQHILGQRPVPAPATLAPVVPRPRQLPPVTAGFVGRDAEIAALDSSLGSRPGGPGTAVITAVSGMAGVGKTALVPGQAIACRLLARADSRLGDLGAAESRLRRSLALYADLGDATGQAQTLHNYIELCYMAGRPAEALRHGDEALRLYRLSGNRDGEARTLNAIGWLHATEGDYEQAIDSCSQALERQRHAGDRNGQAATLDSLGFAYHHLARHDHAVASYEEAVALFRASADRYHEAETLVRLGETLRARGDTRQAEEVWHRAAAIFDALRDPEADAVRERLALIREP
ncbi:BTAD domain-containing putative transcriptional regulator [Streptomyces sp. NPDC006296]|uniref:BTAD domain-containing putative transcriptional regulator n=1 Tax=Streptomyces sp. NPDC006296 TaxID=3156746 RepID=UPI0033BCCC7E